METKNEQNAHSKRNRISNPQDDQKMGCHSPKKTRNSRPLPSYLVFPEVRRRMLMEFPNSLLVSILICCGFSELSLLRSVNNTLNRLICTIVFPLCHELHLEGGSITDHVLQLVSGCLSSLTSLNIWRCPQITDEGIGYIAAQCFDLEKIQLFKCQKLTPVGISRLIKECSLNHTIKEIDLSYCRKITDDCILNIAEYCPHLTKLYLCGCVYVTDRSISRLSVRCPGLTELDLSECVSLSDNSIFSVADHCINLKSLNLWEVPVTDAAFCSIDSAMLSTMSCKSSSMYKCDR